MPTSNRGSGRERNKLCKDTKISRDVISLITPEDVNNKCLQQSDQGHKDIRRCDFINYTIRH